MVWQLTTNPHQSLTLRDQGFQVTIDARGILLHSMTGKSRWGWPHRLVALVGRTNNGTWCQKYVILLRIHGGPRGSTGVHGSPRESEYNLTIITSADRDFECSILYLVAAGTLNYLLELLMYARTSLDVSSRRKSYKNNNYSFVRWVRFSLIRLEARPRFQLIRLVASEVLTSICVDWWHLETSWLKATIMNNTVASRLRSIFYKR